MVVGFKHTEVGVIPNDWNVKSLREVADINQNGGKSIPDEFVYIDLESVTKGRLVKKITITKENAPSRAQRIVISDDILFQTVRPYQRNNLYFKESGNYIASTGYAVIRSRIDSGYLYALLHTDKFVNTVVDLCTGTSYPAINPNILSYIKIPIPPTIVEQTRIATALNDADALINQLEQMLTKKRNIKIGVTQELLTGNKRLNGFKDEWISESLPNVSWYQEGPGLRNWQFTKFGIKVINVTNLENGYLNLDRTDRYISLDEFHKMYEHFEIDENDIVVASSGNSYGKVAVVRKQDLPLVMNTSVIRFKPLKNLDYDFLLAFLKSYFFKDQIDLLITGGAQPNFGPVHLRKIFIKLPISREEQKAIATILSDIDYEIFALEDKLAKYKMLKQGMMQVLLTGKIRLV